MSPVFCAVFCIQATAVLLGPEAAHPRMYQGASSSCAATQPAVAAATPSKASAAPVTPEPAAAYGVVPGCLRAPQSS